MVVVDVVYVQLPRMEWDKPAPLTPVLLVLSIVKLWGMHLLGVHVAVPLVLLEPELRVLPAATSRFFAAVNRTFGSGGLGEGGGGGHRT